MTTPSLPAGQCANSRRPAPGRLALILLGLLSAAPAFAASSGLAGDSADQLRSDAPVSQSLAASAPIAPAAADQALSARDVNLMIVAEAERAKAPAEPTGRIQTVLKRALGLLGTPYRWGGESTEGFDCSGLVGYVFRSALGIELPRVSRDMANNGEKIEKAALTAGDLVFFSRRGKRVDHVGIYVGNGNFVHAPRTGRDVTVSSLTDGYWSGKFMQARRVPGV